MRYPLAVVAPLLALALTLAFGAHLARVPVGLFFLAVVVAGWYGGAGPSLLAALVSLLAAGYFVFPPTDSIVVTPEDALAFTVFAGVALLVGALPGSLARARGQAEQEARRNAELARRFEQAQELAHLGSWEWDITSNRVTWSAELYRLYGLEPREFGATFGAYLERVHPEDRERARETIEASLRTGRPFEMEERIVRPDGSVQVLDSRGEVIHDPSGRPIRMLGVCRDVTAEKSAEERAVELARVEAARGEAEAAARRLRFLAEASAELGASLDYEVTLRNLARLAVPELGDWVGIHLVGGDGTPRPVVVECADPAQRELADALRDRYPMTREWHNHPVSLAIQTGATQVSAEVPDAALAAAATNEEHLRILREVGIRCHATAPLSAAGQVFGALSCAHAGSGRAYGPLDVALIEDVARRAGTAIQNALLVRELEAGRDELERQALELRNREARLDRTLEQLERTTSALRRSKEALEREGRERERAQVSLRQNQARLEAVGRITQALLRRATLDDVLNELLDQLRAALGVDEATILLESEAEATLSLWSSPGFEDEAARDLRIPFGRGIAGRVAATRQPLIIPDLAGVDVPSPQLRENVTSLLAVPLLIENHVLGVLHVGSAVRRDFTEEEQAFLELVAERVASIIERAQLHDSERAARAEAERARLEAETANRARADFLALMSHDLRTPLNAISGYVQLLEIGVHGPLNEPQRQALVRIQQSQERILTALTDLLVFARLETGHVTYQLAELPLDPVLRGLEPLIAPQLEEKRLRYSYVPCDPSLLVRADSEKLEQVLLNLLTNAVKFTGPGGRITLAVDAADAGVGIRVTDTGSGIPADKLSAIFEPFVQIEEAPLRGPGGVGLGLAISRQLARAMGGDVVAESVLGQGSTFILRLPRTTPAPIPVPIPTATS